MYFVDTHAHVFSPEGPFSKNARYTPSYHASLEGFLNNLDKHNIQYGVLIQPSFYGTDNSYMLNAVKEAKGRLKAVIVVDTDISKETLLQYHQLGVCGIRLNLFGVEPPNLLSSEWSSLIKTLTDLDWQLELHCPPSYLLQLLPALRNYSIKVVIDHLGRPSANQNLDESEYQQFLSLLNPTQHWIKLSGLYRIANSDSNAIIRAQTVLIPHENVKDLAEIPDNVKADLEIIPVRWIDQVLEVALEKLPTPLTDKEIAALAREAMKLSSASSVKRSSSKLQ